MKIPILTLACILLFVSVFSQDKSNAKFGKVSPEDFAQKVYSIDSNANAVILDDIGTLDFIGNEHHWFSWVYKKYVRARIINENASDLATVQIRLYGFAKDKDQLSNLKAATYNIDNGVIQTSPVEQNDVFEDKLNAYTSMMKFTFPKVKSGSIIEYSYTITSFHYYNLPTWYFQHIKYPCLHSEYKAIFPSALRYLTVRYGRDSFALNKTATVKNNKYFMPDVTVTSNDIMDFWSMENIPAFGFDAYIGSPFDYLDKIDFLLAQTYNGEEIKDVGSNWQIVTEELLSTSYFGLTIEKGYASNLVSTADRITSGDKSLSESARHLFYYVRDNFTCLPDNEIYLGDDLYDVNKKKKGNVAELNLLLIALLRQKGIHADPVILGTREIGSNPADYPVLDKMNYVICMMKLDGDTVYLDASKADLGFGNLSIDCYNGHARVISRDGGPIYFSPERIQEQKTTNVIVYNNEKGKLSGSCAVSYGVFGSEGLRRTAREKGLTKYFDSLKSKLTGETSISNTGIDSLFKPESPATIHFEFKIPSEGDLLYLNPVILSDYSENPFVAEERKYPVVLDYPIDDLYLLSMEIPEGYDVDEMPKSVKVSFSGDEGSFEYIIQSDQNRIQFRSHVKLNKINFPAEDYNSLRDFFAFIIKKFNEQIVLKKKK